MNWRRWYAVALVVLVLLLRDHWWRFRSSPSSSSSSSSFCRKLLGLPPATARSRGAALEGTLSVVETLMAGALPVNASRAAAAAGLSSLGDDDGQCKRILWISGNYFDMAGNGGSAPGKIHVATRWLQKRVRERSEGDGGGGGDDNNAMAGHISDPLVVITGGLGRLSDSVSIQRGAEALVMREALLSAVPGAAPSDVAVSTGLRTTGDNVASMFVILRSMATREKCIDVSILDEVILRPRLRALVLHQIHRSHGLLEKKVDFNFVPLTTVRLHGGEDDGAQGASRLGEMYAGLEEVACLTVVGEAERILAYSSAAVAGEPTLFEWSEPFAGSRAGLPLREAVEGAVNSAREKCGGKDFADRLRVILSSATSSAEERACATPPQLDAADPSKFVSQAVVD